MQVHVAQFALQYVKCEHTKLTDIPSRVTDSRSCDVIATSPSIGCRDAKKAHDDYVTIKSISHVYVVGATSEQWYVIGVHRSDLFEPHVRVIDPPSAIL